MIEHITNERLPGGMRRSVLSVLILTVVLATIATFFGSYRYFERAQNQTAGSQLVLYLRSLNETLRQHQHLPFILADDPRYLGALLSDQADDAVNARLKALSVQAKLEAIYLMNPEGLVVASSNAGEPHSFLGQNYGFRPYFQGALAGARSDYFAIGATSGRPGYFVAEPIVSDGIARGVMAIKLDVSELQTSWESDSETVVAIDENGIVVLSSNPNWLYRPVAGLSAQLRKRISESRQFGAESLLPLAWAAKGDQRITVDGTTYLTRAGQSDWRGWTVHYLQPDGVIIRQTLFATALLGSGIAFLVGFATYLRSRRIALAYMVSEQQRKELTATNHQLEQAQTELARNAKLAALGHLAGSVTHELVQPIGAFRNHLAAAEIGGEITSPATAKNLHRLVDRMEAITRQFRYFVRGRVEDKTEVALGAVLAEAVSILGDDIKGVGAALHHADIAPEVVLIGHQVQLEQVFTNLLKNAVHAVDGVTKPTIRVTVFTTPESVEIHVSDNGPGLDDASLADLQEPFFSTKPSGVGMGLGLAIASEIIKDHGGTLTLGDVKQGAAFIVKLPRVAGGEVT